MTTAAIIFSFFINAGAQPFQAHALVQHAKAESELLPDPPRTGLGRCLYQWTGERWRRLRALSTDGVCPELEKQLAFALAELREPTFACFWSAPPDRAYAVLRRHFGAGARCPAN